MGHHRGQSTRTSGVTSIDRSLEGLRDKVYNESFSVELKAALVERPVRAS